VGGQVRVVGTVFAVSLEEKKLLLVGVRAGEVQVKPEEAKSPAVNVKADRQVALTSGSSSHPKKLGPKLRKLMNRLTPETPPPKAKKQARLEPVKPAEKKPVPAEEAPKPAKPVKEKKPAEKKTKVDSVEALVESLYKDTRWIFDDLRSQMDQGNWETALNRLNNYLADPESPNRDDALMLKGACLEKLGRFKEAHQIYHHYLLNWPAGPRAREARHGLLRTRRYR
jgi:TolA-binding protein